MKRMLVAVDFSPCSEVALDHAVELASHLHASIGLLHVWEIPNFLPPEALITGAGAQQTLVELVRVRAETSLNDFAERARRKGAGIDSVLSLEGNPAREIVTEAESGGYDLIVVGTHGRAGLSHALLGSVAERVVRHSTKPVLSVRSP